jgi:uncharacterized RDD family membrane protein YckC
LDNGGVDRQQLRIAGLTGVEITLDIAGAGSRSLAFIIDWHIRLLGALAWFLLVSAIGISTHLNAATRSVAAIVIVPALAIYLLYHPILEIFTRGTPGKRMAGVRIVTRQGGTPSMGAMLIRNVFRLIDSLPFLYVAGLVCCLFSAQHVRIGDMAAGTLLILSDVESEASLGRLSAQLTGSKLAPNVIEIVNELLRRWHLLDTIRRDKVARLVLGSADTSLTAEALAPLGDAELYRRLKALYGT